MTHGHVGQAVSQQPNGHRHKITGRPVRKQEQEHLSQ